MINAQPEQLPQLRAQLQRMGIAAPEFYPMVRGRLVRYFEELRSVRLEISGGDLAGLGVEESPRVGEILEELLRRKLNGELDGRAAELDAARELVGA